MQTLHFADLPGRGGGANGEVNGRPSLGIPPVGDPFVDSCGGSRETGLFPLWLLSYRAFRCWQFLLLWQ